MYDVLGKIGVPMPPVRSSKCVPICTQTLAGRSRGFCSFIGRKRVGVKPLNSKGAFGRRVSADVLLAFLLLFLWCVHTAGHRRRARSRRTSTEATCQRALVIQ